MESAPRTRRLAQVALLAIGGCMLSFFLLLDGGYEALDYRRQMRLLAEGGTPLTTAAKNHERGKAWHRDINYKVDIPCGPRMCFFESLTDPARGYMVGSRDDWRWHSSRRGFKSYHLSRLRDIHEFAAEIERDYGVRHFYSSEPFVQEKAPRYFLIRIRRRKRGRFPPDALLEIQPSLKEPEGADDFKCRDREEGEAGPTVFQMKNELRERRRRAKTPGYDKTMLEGLERTIDLVKAVPALAFDFCVRVAPEGTVYQVDLERAFPTFETTSHWQRPAHWQRRTAIREVPEDLVRGVVTCLEDKVDELRKSIKEG